MALNRNDTFNPNDMSWMDAGADPSERGFISKSLRFIFGSAKGIVKGTAEGLLDNVMEEHLDKFQDAKDVFDDFTSATNKATKQLGDDLKEFKSAAKEIGLKYTEGMAGAIPSSLYRRLSRAFEEPDDEDSYSPGDQLEASISSNLASIFSAQARHTAGLHHISMQSAATDRALAAKYHKQDITVALASNRAASNIDNFLHSTYVNYLKKDLELKYRNLHLMRTLSSNVESLKNEFGEEGVIGKLLKNTNPLGQTVGEHARVTTSSYQKNFFSETLDNLTMMPSYVIQSLSGVMSAHAAIPFDGVSDVVASITKHTAPWLLKKFGTKFVSEATQKKLAKKWEKAKLGLDLLNGDFGALSKMAPMKMNALARNLQNSDNWFIQMIGNMMPTFERTTTIENLAATNPKDPAVFDNLTRETIVTIIPEHLSRIGDYIEALSKQQGAYVDKGNGKVWDVRSRSFITRANQRQRNLETIYGNENERKSRYQDNVDAFINLTGAGTIDLKNTALKKQFAGKTKAVIDAQQTLVQRNQAQLSQFIENSAYYLLELDVRALIACANNNENSTQEDYLNKVFGTIDATARNTASTIVKLVTNYDSQNRPRDINRVFVDYINQRILDRAKEYNDYDEIRQQLRDQNQYDHEDYKFNLFGAGNIRVNEFLHGFDNDYRASGDVNVAKRFDDTLKNTNEIEKLDARSERRYKFSRMFSKNAEERLLHDKLFMNTGMASSAMIPGFMLRWAVSGYKYIADKLGWVDGAINDLVDKSDLLTDIKQDIYGKSKNIIIGIKPIKKDPDNPGNMLFSIQVRMHKQGSAAIKDIKYSYKLTQAEYDTFSVLGDKPSRSLKTFIDHFIDSVGKKDFVPDWKQFKIDNWPDHEKEEDKYDFQDIVYGTPKNSNTIAGSSASLMHKYLDSIDFHLTELRNNFISGSTAHSVRETQVRAKLRSIVDRLPKKDVYEKFKRFRLTPEEIDRFNGTIELGISSLYDNLSIKQAEKEAIVKRDTEECQNIFDSAIQEFKDDAFRYYLRTSNYTAILDGDDKEELENKYDVDLNAPAIPPVFDYDDPDLEAKRNQKSPKNPYAPMNAWLLKNKSRVQVKSGGDFREAKREIERIVLSEQRIEAAKVINELIGMDFKLPEAYVPEQPPKPPAGLYRDEATGDWIFNGNRYSNAPQKPIVIQIAAPTFNDIIKKLKKDALQRAACRYLDRQPRPISAELHSAVNKDPGFPFGPTLTFSALTSNDMKKNTDFFRNMTTWIRDNSDAEEKPIVTVQNFERSAVIIDQIIQEQADVDFYKRYIHFDKEKGQWYYKNSEIPEPSGTDLLNLTTNKELLSKYGSSIVTKKDISSARRSLRKFNKFSAVNDNTNSFSGSGIADAIKAFGNVFGGDTSSGNIETYSINPSDSSLSVTDTLKRDKTGRAKVTKKLLKGLTSWWKKQGKLSSSYADGSARDVPRIATLHADGDDEGLFNKIKKAKMFSAVTNWIKAIKNKKDDTNVVAEERKLEKAGFKPEDLIVPATLAVMADKLDVGNAINASADGGGGLNIFGVPLDLLKKVGRGLWKGASFIGSGLWKGATWTAGKIPGLAKFTGKVAQGAGRLIPKIAAFAPAALTGAAMGLGSSLSSGAGTWSTIASTAAHAAAGVAIKAASKLAWPLIFVSAGIAAQQGWTDKAHLKKTFGAMHTATASEKGAAAIGNILNDLSFGALKAVGAQKYIDRAIHATGLGHIAGAIGEDIAGTINEISPDNVGENSELKDVTLLRAKAKLYVDLERGVPGAEEKMKAFEEAIAAKDWALARQISGFHGDSARDAKFKAEQQKLRGYKELLGQNNRDDNPMSEAEIQNGYEVLSYASSRDPEYKDREYDYKECILGERWRTARGIVREVLGDLKSRGDVTASIHLAAFDRYLNPDDKKEEAGRKARLRQLRDHYEKLYNQGYISKSAVDKLDEILNGKITETDEYGVEYTRKATDSDVAYALKSYQIAPVTDNEYKQFSTMMMRRIEDGDQAAYIAWSRFVTAVKKEDWQTARDIMRSRGFSIEVAKAKPMTLREIQNFRIKIQNIISKTNNPFAIQKLREFERAVQDGNWALARKIAISSTSVAKDFDVPTPLTDNKATANTALAKRYRLILDRVKQAMKLNNNYDNRSGLKSLFETMKKTDLVEINSDILDRWESTLRRYSPGAGLMLQADIDKFEQERTNKLKLIEQRDILLGEISAALLREKDRQKGKNGSSATEDSLRKLYNTVDGLTQGELSKELLTRLDQQLIRLDKDAISSTVFSDPEKRQKLIDAQERKQNLLGIIDECKERSNEFNTIKQLNDLQEIIKSVNDADLIDGKLFGIWDRTVKRLDSRARSSKRRTQQEVEQEARMIEKRDALYQMIDDALGKEGLEESAATALQKIKNEIEATSIDDLSDARFDIWEKRYQTIFNSKLTIKEQLVRNDDNAKAIRARNRLNNEAGSIIALYDLSDSTKDIAARLRASMTTINKIGEKQLTMDDVVNFERDIHNAQYNPVELLNKSYLPSDNGRVFSNVEILEQKQAEVGTTIVTPGGIGMGQMIDGTNYTTREADRRTTITYDSVIDSFRSMIVHGTIKMKENGRAVGYIKLNDPRYHDEYGFMTLKRDLLNTDEYKKVLEKYEPNLFNKSVDQLAVKQEKVFAEVAYPWKQKVWQKHHLTSPLVNPKIQFSPNVGFGAINIDNGAEWWLFFLNDERFMEASLNSGAVEQAVSLDRNGNIVDSQTGSETSVSLKTAPGGQIIHTHPDGSPTSATDIAAAIQNKQTAVTTLRSSGNILGYSGQQNKNHTTGETISVKKNEQNNGVELNKALTDMTNGIQNGFNSIDTNRDVLVGIYDRLGDVIDAVSEHNEKVNDRIDITALKSYDLARKFTMKMTQKAKDAATVFRRPSVINISK